MGRLYGVVRSGTANQPIFTLPAGFRPTAQQGNFPTLLVGSATVALLAVNTTGTVVCSQTDSSGVLLDGITFTVD